MAGEITGLQPIDQASSADPITNLQPISGGPQQAPTTPSAAPGSTSDPGFLQKLFDPNYKQADPTLFGSPLAGHVAQSFDIVNLAKNFKDGAMGVAHFGLGLGRDLRDNPDWVLGKHSVYEKYVGAPAEEQARMGDELWGKGRKSEALGHYGAGMIPMIGPYIAKLSEQAGSGDVGGAVGQGLGAYMGGKAVEAAAKTPSQVYEAARDFSNRANSLDAVSNGASAIHKQAVQHIETTVASLKAEGIRTIQDAVQADNAAAKATGGRGTIPTTSILTEGLKAMEEVGYQAVPKPVQAAIARIGAGPANLTLEEAVHLRTAFGDAAAKASGNAKAYYVLNAAREAMNPAIEARFGELGQKPAWNYYNKKFTAAYDIQDGFKDITEGAGNRYESIPKMQKFSNMNLQELQREMKNQGLTQQAAQIETVKTDAKRITEAHDTLSKKMGASMFRLALADPKAAALGIAAATAIHPVAGIGGYLLGTMLSNAMRRVEASMDVGRLGKTYPDPMETITDSGPKQSFKFEPPTAGAAPAPSSGGPAPVAPESSRVAPAGSSGTVEGAKAANKFFQEAKAKLGPDASLSQVAQEAARMEAMSRKGMPYKESEASKASTAQRIKQYNRAEPESEAEMERRRPTGGEPAPRPKETKMSWEDWQKDKKAQEIQERRGEKKKKLEISTDTADDVNQAEYAKKVAKGRAMKAWAKKKAEEK